MTLAEGSRRVTLEIRPAFVPPKPSAQCAAVAMRLIPVLYTGANVNPTPNQPVKGAQNPSVGSMSFCHSGSTTFEHCGHHLISELGKFCDPHGDCTELLDVYEDGVAAQGGDSGAPMFNYPATGGVTIRSVLIAGGSTIYAEKWSALQLHFNVSIVIG